MSRIIKSETINSILFLAVMLSIVFIMIWLRVFIGSMKDFSRGEALFDENQYVRAVTYFDRSMHWYTPFNPYVEKSAEYLWQISNRAEDVNDYTLAIIALETIKNSLYGTRSFYDPGTMWIIKCDEKISALAKSIKENNLNTENIYQQGFPKQANGTEEYNDPDIFWTLILEFGFWGWVGSVIGLIYFFIGGGNKANNLIRNCWFWIILIFTAYGLWIIGMVNA